jgi:hypothetical protein
LSWFLQQCFSIGGILKFLCCISVTFWQHQNNQLLYFGAA